uniref:Unconventional myosin-Va n=1 Tax=Bursaphelenchus xylophilus TaxID=6326 RepID=A0A1I7SAS3_BURXY
MYSPLRAQRCSKKPPSDAIRLREGIMNGTATLGRDDSFPLANFKKGTKIWIKDAERVWIQTEMLADLSFQSKTIKLRVIADDEVIDYDPVKSGMPFLCNPDILLGKDDLTSLSYLHEPAVLNNLQYRFERLEKIYTYSGIVLVAINPYADCSQIYGDDVMLVYRGQGQQVRVLEPHIYAIAEEAYYDMCEYTKNQSIIVSGESGAGKTVSAKFVMRYLTTAASSSRHRKSSDHGIESRVLASNPVMEAIGNAKTIRNDNSSRFGKFIQIDFTDKRLVAGAQMKTYLLEKSRVVFQSQNERNYHIFYQICASANHEILAGLGLDRPEEFYFTKQGNAPEIEGVDDRKEFESTLKAFDLLKIDHLKQREIFRVLAGVLHLGNIAFDAQGDKSSITKNSESWLQKLCSDLFQIDDSQLTEWLTNRELKAGVEKLKKPLSSVDAADNRDALAKLIYSALFTWIVDKINQSLMSDKKETKKGVEASFIGVLDIYGFETFDVNSFEQFCINYANEKLQQQFNQHVFKLEQAEYEREGIAWVRIEYYDNQECIDLIEKRPGILDYLDEQCKTGHGTDDAWLGQLTNCPTLRDADHLQMPKIRNKTFTVRHFAADVSYTVTGFLNKNKDTVNERLLEVVGKTQFGFLKEILEDSLIQLQAGSKRKKTVGIQFRDSLKELITVLSSTRPHYVRCIKPNDEKERFTFEPKRAIQQLRACGVLETVRISATGYPSRWSYDDFQRRYAVLYPSGRHLKPKAFAKEACERWLEPEKFALGASKIFFRTGQVAALEKNRHDVLHRSAVLIQKTWRGFRDRRRYVEYKQAVLAIQAYSRAFIAFRRIKFLQMHRAVVTMQSAVRGYTQRRQFAKTKAAALQIQSWFRAEQVRKEVLKKRFEKSAIVIQKHWRGYMVRRERIHYILKVIKVQAMVRRFLAKKRLRQLKIEAKSVDHFKNLNDGLANKIIELRQKLDAVNGEKNELKVKLADYETMKKRNCDMEAEIKELQQKAGLVEELTRTVESMKDRIDEQEEHLMLWEGRYHDLNDNLENAKIELSTLSEERESLGDLVRERTTQLNQLQGQLDNETRRREQAEREMSEMRDQLIKNADLLTSSNFSREGSMRGDFNKAGFSSGSSDIQQDPDSLRILQEQQTIISGLRRRLDEASRSKDRLENEICAAKLSEYAEKCTSLRAYEAQRIQDLEVSLVKQRNELQAYADALAKSGSLQKCFVESYDRLKDDAERLHEENLGLRALLATFFEKRTSGSPDSGQWSGDGSEDGTSSFATNDLEEQFTADRLVRQYRNTLDVANREIAERDEKILELNRQIAHLEEQYGVNSVHTTNDLSAADTASTTSSNHLITSLVQENLALQNKLSRQSDELAEARAYLRGHSLSSSEGFEDNGVLRLEALPKEGDTHSVLLEVFNVPEFSRILVCDLRPRMAKQLAPGLPAYLLFAAFRYFDQTKDDACITGLFNSIHHLLRETSTNSKDMDVLVLWFVNSWRLLNLLRQFAGEQSEWTAQNTAKQNEWRLQHFNFEPIRNQLKLRIEDFYQNFMKNAVEPLLTPKIFPGILQHESASMVLDADGDKSRGKEKEVGAQSLEDIKEFLNFVYSKLRNFGADRNAISQTFRQISQWMCALAMNQLVFRKDLCTFEKAVQVKHNVTELKNWLVEHELQQCCEHLEPLVQASHLMQSRKEESNIETLCGEMTSRLTPKQVVSILQHYTPPPSFEEETVDANFIAKLSDRLYQRAALADLNGGHNPDTAIMPGTYLAPFDTTPFVYTDFPIDKITLPSCLRLDSVARLI